MKIKMTQQVRWSDGIVRTPREAIDQGIAKITKSDSVHGRKGIVTWCEEIGTDMVVEVSGFVQ